MLTATDENTPGCPQTNMSQTEILYNCYNDNNNNNGANDDNGVDNHSGVRGEVGVRVGGDKTLQSYAHTHSHLLLDSLPTHNNNLNGNSSKSMDDDLLYISPAISPLSMLSKLPQTLTQKAKTETSKVGDKLRALKRTVTHLKLLSTSSSSSLLANLLPGTTTSTALPQPRPHSLPLFLPPQDSVSSDVIESDRQKGFYLINRAFSSQPSLFPHPDTTHTFTSSSSSSLPLPRPLPLSLSHSESGTLCGANFTDPRYTQSKSSTSQTGTRDNSRDNGRPSSTPSLTFSSSSSSSFTETHIASSNLKPNDNDISNDNRNSNSNPFYIENDEIKTTEKERKEKFEIDLKLGINLNANLSAVNVASNYSSFVSSFATSPRSPCLQHKEMTPTHEYNCNESHRIPRGNSRDRSASQTSTPSSFTTSPPSFCHKVSTCQHYSVNDNENLNTSNGNGSNNENNNCSNNCSNNCNNDCNDENNTVKNDNCGLKKNSNKLFFACDIIKNAYQLDKMNVHFDKDYKHSERCRGNRKKNQLINYPSPCKSTSTVSIHGILSQGTEFSFILPAQNDNNFIGKRVSTHDIFIRTFSDRSFCFRNYI